MISGKSMRNFLLTNFVLAVFAFADYCATRTLSTQCASPVFFAALFSVWTATKNAMMLFNIEYHVRHKPLIAAEKRVAPVEQFKGEFALHLFKSSVIEALTKIALLRWRSQTGWSVLESMPLYAWPVYFVAASFLFEIVFDFFHYWAHRTMHHFPWLYKHSHKMHHRHRYPTPIIAFYQDTFDLILSNVLPTLILFQLLAPEQPLWFMYLFFAHKVHTEIAGHTGRDIENTPAFQQFIWLPKWLGFELYTAQHDRHHTQNNCNYAKRFVLWDKVFGTFVN